jgi:hypothetical protein
LLLGFSNWPVIYFINFTHHHRAISGLSLGARGFLAFGALSSAILFGGMVVEEKRRSYNCGRFRWGKMGICGTFWRETKLMAGNYPSVADTVGPLDVSHVFVSSGVPERASESRGWPGLAGWMKAQNLGKNEKPGARLGRMDETPKSGKNEKPGTRLGRIPPSG